MDKKKKAIENEEDKPKKIYGDPEYSSEEDIYSQGTKEEFIEEPDSDEIDLDIPGAELDDQDENIGEEDEENNYYSLGGDDHDDLEETNEDNV
jgi:hypothetical protein